MKCETTDVRHCLKHIAHDGARGNRPMAEITNDKIQITNKFQMSKSKIQILNIKALSAGMGPAAKGTVFRRGDACITRFKIPFCKEGLRGLFQSVVRDFLRGSNPCLDSNYWNSTGAKATYFLFALLLFLVMFSNKSVVE